MLNVSDTLTIQGPPVHAGELFLPAARRSGVTVVAWASSFSSPPLRSGAAVSGFDRTRLLPCHTIYNRFGELEEVLGTFVLAVIGVARKR